MTGLAAPAPVETSWEALLALAALAPSSHNTQPWRFRLAGDRVDVIVDRSRQLGVVDPLGRELLMSCGAAAAHLESAMRGLGRMPVSRTLAGANGDVVASIALGPPSAPSATDRRRLEAIPLRHTNRGPFSERPVDEDLLRQLQRGARAEGAELVLITDAPTRVRIADLVAAGTRTQHGDRAFRRELASWMRLACRPAEDGLSAAALGLGTVTGRVAPRLVGRVDLGRRQAAAERELAARGPVLAVLATRHDAREEWVAAGRALSAVLLDACDAGLCASHFNQPVQVAALRPALCAAAGVRGQPQLLLRLGYAPPAPAAPRRPLTDMVDGGITAAPGGSFPLVQGGPAESCGARRTPATGEGERSR